MSEKTNNIPTYQQFKKIVKYEFENKYKDKGFKLSNVYQIKSREFGFANWNTLNAILKKNDIKNGICWCCENNRNIGNGNKKRACPACESINNNKFEHKNVGV